MHIGLKGSERTKKKLPSLRLILSANLTPLGSNRDLEKKNLLVDMISCECNLCPHSMLQLLLQFCYDDMARTIPRCYKLNPGLTGIYRVGVKSSLVGVKSSDPQTSLNQLLLQNHSSFAWMPLLLIVRSLSYRIMRCKILGR